MTQPNDEGTTETTFTRAQFARELAKQVREKVAATLAEYGDLDELKAKAAEADKQRSAIERIEQKLDEQTKRAEKAERDALIREVADELGVSVRIARKFEGTSKAELLADGRETLSDMGIEPDKSKRAKSTTGTRDADQQGKQGDDETDEGETGTDRDEGDDQQAEPEPRETRQRPRRPVETLRSGRPASRGEAEETDPLKLVANIPRM